jgi:hypothetical protein
VLSSRNAESPPSKAQYRQMSEVLGDENIEFAAQVSSKRDLSLTKFKSIDAKFIPQTTKGTLNKKYLKNVKSRLHNDTKSA